MLVTLTLAAALLASAPFPVDGADPDLARLRAAWASPATSEAQRGELDARLRAAGSAPDWRRVADDYFAWRRADAAADDRRRAELLVGMARAMTPPPPRPPACTTETRSEPGLFGVVVSSSRTRCDR